MTTQFMKRVIPALVYALLIAYCPMRLFAASRPLAGRVIVIDPGHAVRNEAGVVINPGARARHGAFERDVALSVAIKLVPMLEARGAKIYMTRTATNPWRYMDRKSADNRSRAVFANMLRAQTYVRLHCDWNRSRKFQGFTTYYYRWGSRPLAKAINNALAAALPDHRDNGIHRRSFVSVTARMPSVLVEMGVLSNRKEATDLALDAFQNRVAQSIVQGLEDYYSGKVDHWS